MILPLDWRVGAADTGCLSARSLHLQRGGRAVLYDVDLTARPGRVLVLVGPNGAGKSSLLELLAGLRKPTRGLVTLDGRSLARWHAPELARRRAMLSQHVQLGFGFRAWEVVALARGTATPAARAAAGWIEQALQAAQVLHLRDRRYTELSGGEQRRVQFARVLAQLSDTRAETPPWLMLDEPEAGLDIAHQHTVLREASARARHGWGVIVVLHDLNLAARYADDIALLANGRLLRHGPPDAVLEGKALSAAYGCPLRHVATADARAPRVIVAG